MTSSDPEPRPDPLDPGLRAAFSRRSVRSDGPTTDPRPSVLDSLALRSGMRPRVALRDEPSGEGDRPVKPLTGRDTDVPQTTGKYQIQGELARGGVGAVFKGHDTDLGRDVAMKLLHEKYLDQPDVIQRFVEEAQIGGQLQHPGIVPVYDLGLSGDRPYFTMKLIKGQTLASLLEDRESPTHDRRRLLSIFEQVCQTMAYAHSRGVIHRDLKPANIMVGSFGEVQVVDWGMGKVLPRGGIADEARTRVRSAISVIETVRSDGDSSQSLVGSVMGTPAYMPPEQANGAVEQMDERSDVFALGAVLCEILTGVPPYPGPGAEALNAAARAELGPCHERLAASGADPELVELVRDCLMPAPPTRPRDARRLAQRLAHYLASLEERTREAKIQAERHRVEALVARRSMRLTLALATSIIATLTLTGTGYWWYRDQQQRQRDATTHAVEAALADANSAYDHVQESEAIDLADWVAVTAAVERATALVATADVSPALRARVEEVATRSSNGRRRAQRAVRERAMVAHLEEIAGPTSEEDESGLWVNPFRQEQCAERDAAYRQAFADFGLPVEEMDHNDSVLAILEAEDRSVWVAALDDWAMAQEVLQGEDWPTRNKLLEIVAQLDDSPFRQRWLDLLIRGQVTVDSLRELLAHPEAETMSVSTALAIAARLDHLEEHALHLEVLERAHRHHPDNFWLVMQIAQLCHGGRQSEFPGRDWNAEALRYFTAATALRPQHVHALWERGHCAKGADLDDEAIACFAAALARAPGHRRALKNLVTLLKERGRVEEAVEWCNAALETETGRSQALISLSELLEESAPLDSVLTSLEQIVLQADADEEAPIEALWKLPQALEAVGELDRARRARDRVIPRVTGDADAANNLAWWLANAPTIELRDPGMAVRLARRALELEPGNATFRNTLGAALYRNGELEDAALELALCLRDDKLNHAFDYLFLALVRREQGQAVEANRKYRQALDALGSAEPLSRTDRAILSEARAIFDPDHR